MTEHYDEEDGYGKAIVKEFEKLSGLNKVECEIEKRNSESLIFIYLAYPNDRFYVFLAKAIEKVPQDSLFPAIALIKKKKKDNLIESAEGMLFRRKVLANLTVNRYSFGEEDEFSNRYIPSVINAEQDILTNCNHIVHGRRGSGKSSLLLYAMLKRKKEFLPSIWIDMQAYKGNKSYTVAVDICLEIIDQLHESHQVETMATLRSELAMLSKKKSEDCRDEFIKLIPKLKRHLARTPFDNIMLFLDDFHLIPCDFQPMLLDLLYSIFRGTCFYLKISSIESYLKRYDPIEHKGLEVPHDVQIIQLDYNLTMMKKSTTHIENILDAYANYCGISSARNLCTSKEVIKRLIWVAAGVIRDALNIFIDAMNESYERNQKFVSVTNLNKASSKMVGGKIKEIEEDTSEHFHELKLLIDKVKEFCIKSIKSNAFRVKITSSEGFLNIKKLIDLRLLHIVNEGMTVAKAGERYLVLILDYGYYVGARAARSIDFFNLANEEPSYKELRKLKEFRPDD